MISSSLGHWSPTLTSSTSKPVEGTDIVTFTCTTSTAGNISFSWKKGEHTIYNETQSTLHLYNVSKDSSGSYTCTTDCYSQMTSNTVYLDVQCMNTFLSFDYFTINIILIVFFSSYLKLILNYQSI